MELFFTYALVEPKLAVLPLKVLNSYEEYLKLKAKRLRCDRFESIRLQLIVGAAEESKKFEIDGRELVVTCYITAADYRSRRTQGKEQLLREISERILEDVVSRFGCTSGPTAE